MENAAGSADDEMSIIEDSIEFKINALKETWVGTITEILSRDDVKYAIDGLIKLSEAIGFVIEKLGALGSLAGVAGAFLMFKNAGNINTKLFDFISSSTKKAYSDLSSIKLPDTKSNSKTFGYDEAGKNYIEEIFRIDENASLDTIKAYSRENKSLQEIITNRKQASEYLKNININEKGWADTAAKSFKNLSLEDVSFALNNNKTLTQSQKNAIENRVKENIKYAEDVVKNQEFTGLDNLLTIDNDSVENIRNSLKIRQESVEENIVSVQALQQEQSLLVGSDEELIIAENTLAIAEKQESVAGMQNIASDEAQLVATLALKAGIDEKTYSQLTALSGEEELTLAGLKNIASLNMEKLATDNLTKSELLRSQATAKQILEQHELTAAINGTSAASKAAMIFQGALTIGFSVLAGVIASVVIKAVDDFIHRTEKAVEAMNSAVEKFKTTTSEIQSMNEELLTTKERIFELKELQKAGSISIADENELELLKEQNKELARQIVLKNQERIDAQNEILEKEDILPDNIISKYSVYDPNGLNIESVTLEEEMGRAIDKYKEFRQEVDSTGKDLSTNIEGVNEYIKKIWTDSASARFEALNTLKTYGVEFTEQQKSEYDSLSSLRDMYILYCYEVQHTKEAYEALSEEQKKKVLTDKLLAQGLTQSQIDEVFKNINPEQYDSLYEIPINFVPRYNKYGFIEAEEYGRQYAEAWLNGANEVNEKSVEIEPDIFKLSEEQQNAIDDYKSKISSLQSYLEKVRDVDYQPGDLSSLLKDFPEYIDLMDKVKDGSITLEEAILELSNGALKDMQEIIGDGLPEELNNDLQRLHDDLKTVTKDFVGFKESFSILSNVYDVKEEFDKVFTDGKLTGKLSEQMLNSFAGIDDEMNQMVALFYSGIVGADDLYSALSQHYDDDLKNYAKAILLKNQYNEQYYESLGYLDSDWIDNFWNDYNVDLKNCRNYNNAKLAIEAQTLGQLSFAWSRYYDATAKAYTDEIEILRRQASNNAERAMELSKLMQQVQNYEKAANALDEVPFEKLKSSFEGVKSGLGDVGSAGSSAADEIKEAFEEVIDWIETKMASLERHIGKIEGRIADAFRSTKRRQHAYNMELDSLLDKLNSLPKAHDEYIKKANEVGLDEEWAKKVRDGDLSIYTVTDEELKKKIDEYKEWYDKAVQTYVDIEEVERQIIEARLGKIQLKIDIEDSKLKKLENILDKFNFRLDLTELFGGLGSSSIYNSMIANTQKQIDNLRRQNDLLREQQNIEGIDKNSEKWRELQETIDSNDASILNMLLTIAQYTQTIANLRNEKRDKRLSRWDEQDELNRLRMENAIGYRDKNRFVGREDRNIDKRLQEYAQTVTDNRANLKDLRKSSRTGIKGLQDKDLANKIKSKIDERKQIPTSLLDKVAKVDKNLYETLVTYNNALIAYETSKKENELYKEQAKQAKVEMVKQRFENIQNEYSNRQGLLDQRTNAINNAMEIAEGKGFLQSTKYYDYLIDVESKRNESLSKEYNRLVKELKSGMESGAIQKYSDAWYELSSSIEQVKNELDGSTKKLIEYGKAQEDVFRSIYDKKISDLSSLIDENNFIIGELSRNGVTDKDNSWLNTNGESSVALQVANSELIKRQLRDVTAERERVEALLKEDPYNEELLNYQSTLIKNEQDYTKALYDTYDAMKNLYQEGYNSVLDKIGDMISEYNDLLDKQKDVADYQKRINDASKNIGNIKKQLAAYAGDDSEENRARIQKLQVQLEDAQKSLEETQYDHMISEQKRMMSDFKDTLSDDIQYLIDNLNPEEIIKEVRKNAEATDNISKFVKEIDYNPSNGFKVEVGTNDIKGGVSDAISTIEAKLNIMIELANAEAERNAKASKTANEKMGKQALNADTSAAKSDLEYARSNQKEAMKNYNDALSNQTKAKLDIEKAQAEYDKIEASIAQKRKDIASYTKKYGLDSAKTQGAIADLNILLQNKALAAQRFDTAQTNYAETMKLVSDAESNYKNANDGVTNAEKFYNVMDYIAKNLELTNDTEDKFTGLNSKFYEIYGNRVLSNDAIKGLAELLGVKNNDDTIMKALKKMGINGFKVGSHNILASQLALLGEEGMELQFKRGQGTLGVVGNGDMIFTNEQAENLWKLSKISPVSFGNNISPIIPKDLTSNIEANRTYSINVGDIVLPDVTNPEQFAQAFKDAIKNNGSVQKMLKETTIGSLSKNNNSLGIRRY